MTAMDEQNPAFAWEADGDQSFSIADPKPAPWVRQLIETSPIASVVSDPRLPDNPIVAVNQPFVELTGYPPEEILGRNCRFLQGPKTNQAQVAKLREANALNFGQVRAVVLETTGDISVLHGEHLDPAILDHRHGRFVGSAVRWAP